MFSFRQSAFQLSPRQHSIGSKNRIREVVRRKRCRGTGSELFLFPSLQDSELYSKYEQYEQSLLIYSLRATLHIIFPMDQDLPSPIPTVWLRKDRPEPGSEATFAASRAKKDDGGRDYLEEVDIVKKLKPSEYATLIVSCQYFFLHLFHFVLFRYLYICEDLFICSFFCLLH